MSRPVPHTTPPHYPDRPAGRFGATIETGGPAECTVALIGLVDDEGVRLNGGRVGAAAGPSAFRAALARYGVARPQGFEWPRVFDAGDVRPGATLGETHARVTEAVDAVLALGLFPIAVGGGHDLTFPVVRAVAGRAGPMGGVYFDAHLDVRETAGSGMGFRRLVDECGVGPLLVHGLNPLVNAREHVAWFYDHGGTIADDDPDAEDDDLLAPLAGAESLFCSFDLDCLDASHAPGVSAPNPAGMTVREAARRMFIAASDPRLRCLDIMELCPTHDQDGRTARAAAHLFLHALMGLRLGPLLHAGTRGSA